VVARRAALLPAHRRALAPGAVLAGAVVSWTVIARPVLAWPVQGPPVLAQVFGARTRAARAALLVRVGVAVLSRAIGPGPVLAWATGAGTVWPCAIVTGTVHRATLITRARATGCLLIAVHRRAVAPGAVLARPVITGTVVTGAILGATLLGWPAVTTAVFPGALPRALIAWPVRTVGRAIVVLARCVAHRHVKAGVGRRRGGGGCLAFWPLGVRVLVGHGPARGPVDVAVRAHGTLHRRRPQRPWPGTTNRT
jgi:hypothetical protein